jgi:hypothetical protein
VIKTTPAKENMGSKLNKDKKVERDFNPSLRNN